MTLKAIDRQLHGSRFVNPHQEEWQPTDAPGFLVKTIFEDGRTGESTMLMKIEPGAFFPDHAHEKLEEIFVLDGDFYDAEASYGPGQYCQRAIGAMHTAGSEHGCTVLVVYRN